MMNNGYDPIGAEWISINSLSNPFEQQIDANKVGHCRHRRRGNVAWHPGLPPQSDYGTLTPKEGTQKMDFQIDREELLDLAAQKIADQYCDLDHISEKVNRMVTNRVEAAVGKTLEERVEKILDDVLSYTLDQTIQPVNIFGEKTGEPTTLKDELVDRAKDFWNTRVGTDGKPLKKGNAWGVRDSKTRAEWMLGKIVAEEFANQVRANNVAIAAAFKEAMRKDAHAMIDKHIDSLVKGKG